MRRKVYYVILPIVLLGIVSVLVVYNAFQPSSVKTYNKVPSGTTAGGQSLSLHVVTKATPVLSGSDAVSSATASPSEINAQNPQQSMNESTEPAPSQVVPVRPSISPIPIPSPAPSYPCQYGATAASKCPTCPPCGGYGNGGRLCPMVAGGTPTYMCAVPCGYASTNTEIACRE